MSILQGGEQELFPSSHTQMDSPWDKTHGLFVFEEVRYTRLIKEALGG